jgi:hypothetical protein
VSPLLLVGVVLVVFYGLAVGHRNLEQDLSHGIKKKGGGTQGIGAPQLCVYIWIILCNGKWGVLTWALLPHILDFYGVR